MGYIKALKILTNIDLSDTVVDDAGLDLLVDPENHCEGYRILNLVNTRATPAGIERFRSKVQRGDLILFDGKFGKGIPVPLF